MGNGTEIGRVRGLGSAHSGAHHWLIIRYTAIGSLVLTVWLIASLLMLPAFDYQTVHDWITRPVPATAMALLILANVWHARLGIQVVIEDYVHENGTKFGSIIVLNLIAFAAAAYGLFCILRLALGGA